MSKYVLITGLENNSDTCRKMLAKAMNQVHSMQGIGDDDNDQQAYLVYTSENPVIMNVADQYSKDHKLSSVALLPEFESSPFECTTPNHVRRFKGSNKFKIAFENSDIVVNIGEPSDYSRSAAMYGLEVLQMKEN